MGHRTCEGGGFLWQLRSVPQLAADMAWCQVLPLNRIKRLMKEEADVKAVSAEASYAAARATVRAPRPCPHTQLRTPQ